MRGDKREFFGQKSPLEAAKAKDVSFFFILAKEMNEPLHYYFRPAN